MYGATAWENASVNYNKKAGVMAVHQFEHSPSHKKNMEKEGANQGAMAVVVDN
jgi:hypothetical protein